ncbi:putative MFS family arabinose efflux permease [Litorimonas taeanensis]|uniref:Putative MFS family arabinose efflux permease n=1 Tax=Litorimonas taeanensis TaxID=568099 RepID=A0A420WLH1_9PROT|nr:MFS transporter [Litorimonas taeanensis]RKQ71878.1 putative MFS family arabinose efflux permease [Litorimonas taeanensis]
MTLRSKNKWYLLFILTMVYTLNHVDRQVMVILSEPIKQEFGLSDTQLGLLTGIVFAAFYAVLGIPFAAWADRGNRRNIIALALTIWSGMTALSAFAGNYGQLALARMGVGIGEAGGTPPATAMIADVFPPKRRALALGIYTTGISLGILFGFILGGAIAAKYGWRMGFFVAGVPGLFLALVLLLTVSEPRRGQSEERVLDENVPSLKDTLRFFLSQRAMIGLLLGGVFVCISANAFLVGIPLYLIRVHEVPIGELGIALGLLMGGLGGIGAIGIGALCDKLSEKDLRWRPWTILLTGLIAGPFIVWFLYAPDKQTAYWVYTVPGLFGLLYASISYTAMQELVPVRMRAMASAVMLLCMTLIGIGLGPVILGMISDYYASTLGTHSIQRALTIIMIFNVLSIVFYIDSARHYRAGVARAEKSGI